MTASASFLYLASTTASTKRSAQTGALSGTPATYLTNIKCTPLEPVSAEVAIHLKLESGYATKQTFMDESLDIKEGDVLVIGSVSYPIRAVGPWPWLGSYYLAVVVEELKG